MRDYSGLRGTGVLQLHKGYAGILLVILQASKLGEAWELHRDCTSRCRDSRLILDHIHIQTGIHVAEAASDFSLQDDRRYHMIFKVRVSPKRW